MKVVLKLFALDGCAACSMLSSIIDNIISSNLEVMNYVFEKIIITSETDFKNLGLRLEYFPTLLAYKDNKLRLGWEGFAALAPDEIKREMVEDVLRQVAALADEGDVPHEMPQQVRNDK